MKALVTRPRDDAASLAAALAGRGIEPLLEPLLEIRFAARNAIWRRGLGRRAPISRKVRLRPNQLVHDQGSHFGRIARARSLV